jgi:hypothetical protein
MKLASDEKTWERGYSPMFYASQLAFNDDWGKIRWGRIDSFRVDPVTF